MPCTPGMQHGPGHALCSQLDSYLPRFWVHRSFLDGGGRGEGAARAQREGTVTTGAQWGPFSHFIQDDLTRSPNASFML